MNVKVDTSLLESGSATIKKYFADNEIAFDKVKAISIDSCESLSNFKAAIINKFNEYNEHQSILSNKLTKCAEKLIAIDTAIGSSPTTSLANINDSEATGTSTQTIAETNTTAVNTNNLTTELSKEALNMEPGVHILDYTLSNGNTMQYVVRVPQNATENMPVIFWVHGSGEQGNSNVVSKVGPIKAAEKLGENRFLIIQPVLQTYAITDQNLKNIDLFIDEMQPVYKYDANRIILSGYSSGGKATWYLGNATPNKYAGIAPASIHMYDDNFTNKKLENLKYSNLPIYAMAGNGENEFSHSYSNNVVINNYKEINPNRDLTSVTIDGLSHAAFDDEGYTQDFFDWCIKQNKLNNSII